ncbi:MAG: hypothetical protein CVT92_05345 [Bacteroidetes bacterium HGW-Bacteroidetes-1]|jgi:formate hydrogenlyase subunit 3/multisubunit Na+/H+ antiporter MnhD subunit|nr:MAG: hypothetical protein CVT92_05345 [Bacteroidetes bacterium HGW-Bacteroidetes-1]
MEKHLLEVFNLIGVLLVILIPFLTAKKMGIAVLTAISLQVLLAFILVYRIFSFGFSEFSYSGSFTTGEIPIRFDYLSAWFIMLISFTFLTGTWYGVQYMKKYKDQTSNLALHSIALTLAYTSLINICVVQNALVFLVVWEIMALSSFTIIIFEHYKKDTLKAGINFLIQSHISILLLTIGFIYAKVKTGSYDFALLTNFTTLHPSVGLVLFMLFFTGFAIKSGFVPFHTWLPLAHPAAPAHISGIMSGVIIKIGIFGILRMLTFIKTDFTVIGYFVLLVSIISGLYGVMLAIVQHNLKRLLAYHSIENIGIIGIGIGLGCLGIGTSQQWLIAAGFGGALLHTLNHSLFKSLLFYSTGNIYQLAHTVNIESLGGLIKRIPRSSYLFLVGSLAICGLPPFNGFVSEFFIYSGLFKGIQSSNFLFILVMLFSILALVLIGGLALICFTKAFGIVFLGTNRSHLPDDLADEKPLSVFPLTLIAFFILLIGIFPMLFSSMLLNITNLFQYDLSTLQAANMEETFDNLTAIGLYSLGFMVLTALMLYIRHRVTNRLVSQKDITWGCGYVGDNQKMQYTASSFIRTYRKLVEPILLIKKEKKLAVGMYPGIIEQITHPYDKIERAFIDKPIYYFKRFLNRFVFLQNGNIQSYILYGFIFLTTVFLLPLIIAKIFVVINFLNQL